MTTAPTAPAGRPQPSVLKKIGAFTLVGVVGAICDYGSRAAMIALGLPPAVARGGSYIIGSTVAYYLNSFFTFSGDRSAAEKTRAIISYIICFTLAVAVDALVRHTLPSLPYLMTISWVASQGVATVTNFLLQNFWVFRAGNQPKA